MTNLFNEAEKPQVLSRRPKLQGSGHADNFQTPATALEPLFPYLNRSWHIWEPSAGKGNLVSGLCRAEFRVTGSDILPDSEERLFIIGEVDFLTQELGPSVAPVDCIITNPPFSLKDEFLTRCYALGKPFALLLPFTALEGQVRQALYREHGLELIVLPRRVNFETPSGKGSSSWFGTAWFTWKLGVGQQLTFIERS